MEITTTPGANVLDVALDGRLDGYWADHLDHALADDLHVAAGELLQNGEHQLLLAQGRRIFDLVLFRKGEKFHRGLGLEVLEFDFPHGDDPWAQGAKI